MPAYHFFIVTDDQVHPFTRAAVTSSTRAGRKRQKPWESVGSRAWSLEVRDQGVGLCGFSSGLSPWPSRTCLLAVFTGFSSACPNSLSVQGHPSHGLSHNCVIYEPQLPPLTILLRPSLWIWDGNTEKRSPHRITGQPQFWKTDLWRN